ncbi:sensor histidine kinase [Planktomarina sp.]|uniref:sensor histidine kinase n=1 Tax=Planktomarina sp. TaxID=2024851 RepID=UPI003C5865B9
MFQTLSGRFFIVTVLFVVLAEILILVPSVARFRLDYLRASLERAQIASLALEAEDRISSNLEAELLETAEVYNVVLRRNEVRQLVLSSPIPAPVVSSFDLRDPTVYDLVFDGLAALFDPSDHVIRVIGDPVRRAGLLIEITMSTRGLHEALVAYASQVLWVSTAISALTAVLLFWAVRQALLLPMRHVVSHMKSYANAPEDARSIIAPDARLSELREAQEAMKSMQIELTGALKQKERLAQLGGAVAKISHDLRNILSSAQLFTDRIEASDDPTVARLAPKLVRSISLAIHLCETTLAFGRAEEAPPQLEWLHLPRLFADVVEAEQLASEDTIIFTYSVAEDLQLWADPEQLYRVISNLCRNARQALEAGPGQGQIELSAAEEQGHWWIKVTDNGPGLPERAKNNLFTAFQGGTTKGGSGLGLAISAELIRGHGGRLSLAKSDAAGSIFTIELPKINN